MIKQERVVIPYYASIFIISAVAGILLNLKLSTFFSKFFVVILTNSDILLGSEYKREI